MPTKYIRHVRDALAWLKPHDVQSQVERPLRVGLYGASDLSFFHMESFLTGEHSPSRKAEVAGMLVRATDVPGPYDLEIRSDELPGPANAFPFAWHEPEKTVEEILDARQDLELPLARSFCPFRRPATRRIIRRISRENAMFSVASALPDVIPLFSIPWAVGEFASDTAFLTANQIRMAFLLAAASNRPVGYREQRNEIGSIVAGAFGWRAVARELAGKIPLGGGLIPKAAIAYAGTRVAGISLERYYRIGYGLTASERAVAYDQAFERGKKVATGIVQALKAGRHQLSS